MKTVEGNLYTFLGYIYPINKKDFEIIKKLWRKRWSKKVLKKICNDYKKENIKIWSSYIKKVISDEKIKSDNEFALEDCGYGDSNIKLISAGDDIIQLIKEIRDIFGYGLADTYDLINSVPSIICKNIDYDSAIEIKQKLEAIGAIISIENNNK